MVSNISSPSSFGYYANNFSSNFLNPLSSSAFATSSPLGIGGGLGAMGAYGMGMMGGTAELQKGLKQLTEGMKYIAEAWKEAGAERQKLKAEKLKNRGPKE